MRARGCRGEELLDSEPVPGRGPDKAHEDAREYVDTVDDIEAQDDSRCISEAKEGNLDTGSSFRRVWIAIRLEPSLQFTSATMSQRDHTNLERKDALDKI